MSYIEDVLRGKKDSRITDFLLSEGFKEDDDPCGWGKCMLYIARGEGIYQVWISIFEEEIRLYAEYDCGGEVGTENYNFKKENMRSFMKAYKDAVNWTKGYMD